MTIVASVKVRDGLILATDSMTQISVPTDAQVLKSYSNARKLFQIAPQMGALTYGLGNIGQRSIEGVVLDFLSTYGDGSTSVQDVSGALYDFVKFQYEGVFAGAEPDERKPALQLFVAPGYSEGQPFPEEFEFLLPRDDAPLAARPADVFGASWRGIDAPFTRLYKGFDPYVLPPASHDERHQRGGRLGDLRGQRTGDGCRL